MSFITKTTVVTYPDNKEYEAEVGVIADIFLGYEDHGMFAYRIDIEELGTGSILSSGDRLIDPRTGFGLAFIAKLIKTFGGDYNSSLSSIADKQAILIRDRTQSPLPVGIACPETSEILFFEQDYTKSDEGE